MKLQNAFGQVFYGLHMAPGVAEYNDGGTPYRILLNENTIKQMDPTFVGRPVYVNHVAEVDKSNLGKGNEDGWVTESFYNKSDGKHWVKFIVTSDKGLEAIRKGWMLSNAYIPTEFSGGGLWHGVEYAKEVTKGEYEHLAIVPDPRYAESKILTPDQFKAYNESKEIELKRLENSKGETSVLQFFKKTKVENSTDLENTVVTLPKSKVDKTLTQIVNELDTVYNMQGYASPDHMVKINDMEEMSVGDLANKYNEMCMAKKNAEEEAKKKENMGDEGDEKAKKDKDAADKTENEIDKEGEDKDMKDAKKENSHFKALQNAHLRAEPEIETKRVDLGGVARGKAKYGSNPKE